MMNLTSNGNGNGNGHGTPYLKIALLIFAVVLVGFLLFRQVTRSYGPVRSVWVAATDLASGTVVSEQDMKPKKMREKSLSQGALQDAFAISGRQLSRGVAAGDVFTTSDFAIAAQARRPITEFVPDGRVMMSVTLDAKAAPVSSLVQGDRMDILTATSGRIVARDAYMIGTIGTSPSRAKEKKKGIFGFDLTPPSFQKASSGGLAVLLGITPDDVFPLAQAQSSGADLTIVLHGRAGLKNADMKVEIETPESSHPAAVELIAGGHRNSVVVKR